MDVKRPVKRLSRAEQQERTRSALLDAAIELFIEKGVEATSIEEVTAQAGYSRGAFYSNFESKDDLFLQACDRFLENIHAAALPAQGIPDGVDAGTAYGDRLRRLRGVVADRGSNFLAEVALHAIRHPELRVAVGRQHQQQLEPAKTFVKAVLEGQGISDAPATLEQLANLAQAITFALHFFEQIDPAVEAEATIEVGMRLLMRGLVQEAGAKPKARR